MARVDVLLSYASDSDALTGAIPTCPYRRRKPVHVADYSYMPPWNFAFNKWVNDNIAFVGRGGAAVDVTSPLNLNATFNIVKHVVLLEQLRRPHALAKHETPSEKKVAARILDALPFKTGAKTSNVVPARMLHFF